ncbi:hypothetical protein N9C25_01165 [Saprospiraceae bacterium]|nr:hypothetical protein [Saprospiraceae bacterium]MDC1289692.1 hypothetical protein [bacterium]|tara:strand:+ start:1688 stop:1891 length:204 start_codon:yes stop_codon:yes gene_type:complete
MALRLFEYLFKVADHYDNILIDNFNTKWLIILDLYGMVFVYMLNVENNINYNKGGNPNSCLIDAASC